MFRSSVVLFLRWLSSCAVLVSGGALQAQGPLLRYWSGALTANGIRVNVMVDSSCTSIRLQADDDPDWSSPIYSPQGAISDTTGGMVHLYLTGLDPDTPYRYRFEVNGAVDTAGVNTGRFRTPGAGPTDFSFVVGSCNTSGDHPVWESMGWSSPLFFLSTGDLHYADPNSADLDVHREAYVNEVYARPAMMGLLHRAPIAYVWDDHDFSGNASMASAIGKDNAARAYREHVPHYPLSDAIAVHQAFTIGRVRFILADMRSEKTDSAMMSAEQYVWLKAELQLARDSGLVACWVTPLSWNATGYPENWGAQPEERTALSDWLRANHIKDLFILCGDAHMLAIDSGENGDFTTDHDSPYRYPVFQAAALNRAGSYKGGTYDQGGYFLNPTDRHGQFGEVIVEDDGVDVCVTFRGWRTDSMAAAITLVNDYTFCRTPRADDGLDENPVSGELHAWFDGAGSLVVEGVPPAGTSDVVLVDVSGRVVMRREAASSGGRSEIAVGPLAAGVYVLRARTSNSEHAAWFVIAEPPVR